MRREAFNKIRNLMNRPLSRRGLVNVMRLAWAYKKSINEKEAEILRRHCGVEKKLNPKHPFIGYIADVDQVTGQINLKYDPMDVDQDYYS